MSGLVGSCLNISVLVLQLTSNSHFSGLVDDFRALVKLEISKLIDRERGTKRNIIY